MPLSEMSRCSVTSLEMPWLAHSSCSLAHLRTEGEKQRRAGKHELEGAHARDE